MRIQDIYPNGSMLWYNDFYLDSGKLIFSAGNFNGLYEYSIIEKKLKFIGNFINEGILSQQLYGKVNKYKQKLIYAPLAAENIALYDLESGKFGSIKLPRPKVACGYESKFLNSIMFDNKIYMFPGYAPYIAECNLEREKVNVFDSWYDEYMKKWGKESYLLFNYDLVMIENQIYLPSAQHSGLFRYVLDRNQFQFIEVQCNCQFISTIAYDGQRFWCSTNSGKLLILETDGTIIDEVDISLTYGHKGAFTYSVYENGHLWLFLSQESMILKINCNNYKHDFLTIRYSQYEKEYTNFEYHTVDFVEKKKDAVYFMSRSDREVKRISGGEVTGVIEGIHDVTGFSAKEIRGSDFYKAYQEQMRRKAFFCSQKYETLMEEKTAFSETISFLIEEMNLGYRMNGLETGNGKRIYMECLK